MRLSLRKPKFEFHSEASQNPKPEVKAKVESDDAITAKLMFLLKENMDFCRRSLR
ncbi:hypothetical protein VB780_06625 [Leptolyngbya sp. CCNP1308]|uniref:hypothetical protein n=1 Tax=Leptolyngbya sp. CCNP1308 TaxID=3110255 RepID=UPI002B21F9A8|nr:hypothetical protein [Leptolyngbya sp. CCNP1308]MEA5448237.1 hypothetical protein [Leptolyngbya sp. CCNP1308]